MSWFFKRYLFAPEENEIKSLKERIQNDKGGEYHAEGMKLLFAGKILDDEKTIGDYSINDKGFIVIVVPRPKTPGKESGKKSRSSHPQFPGISTILENALYSNADPTDPTIPVDYTQWRDRDRYPQSGNSSDYETSAVESHGKVIRSRVSSDSGQPGRSSKRHSYRNSTASESSIRAAMMREVSRGGVVSPEAASSATNEVPPLESYNTMDEMPKNAEVSNWLERHVEAPVPVVERSLSIDETVNENVRKIVAMGFEREDAEVALNASFNSVEGAVEYLCRPASAQPEARVPAFAYIPPVVQRFPSVVRSRTDLDDPLEFLKTNEAFQLLRLEVQRNPDLLPSALEGFRSSHSDLEPIFQAFEDRLVELLTEPLDDSPSLVSSTVVMDTSNVVMDTEQSPVTNLSTLELKENEILVDPSHHHMITMSPKSLDRLDPVRSSSSDTDLLLLDPTRSSSSDTDQLLLDPARSSSSDTDQLLLDPARSSFSDKDQLLLDPVRSSSDADQLLVDPARSSLSDKDQLLLDRLDPVQSSSTDTDRLLELPIASDDSTSSSPVPSSIERRVPPVGEDMSGIEALPEDVGSELLGEEDEEKLSEELIRALLLQDQEEEEERVEAERRAAGAAEAVSWSDAESLENSIAGGVRGLAGGGGVGGVRGGRGGGRTLEDRGYVRVTMEEKQAIDRLKSLGFSEERVVQVYLACEKNEEMAANILLDKD